MMMAAGWGDGWRNSEIYTVVKSGVFEFFFFFLDRAVPPVNIHFASNNNIQNIKKNG
jgi:hypothetical protein